MPSFVLATLSPKPQTLKDISGAAHHASLAEHVFAGTEGCQRQGPMHEGPGPDDHLCSPQKGSRYYDRSVKMVHTQHCDVAIVDEDSRGMWCFENHVCIISC